MNWNWYYIKKFSYEGWLLCLLRNLTCIRHAAWATTGRRPTTDQWLSEVVRGRRPFVKRFFAVGKRLSVIGDWLFEHFGRLEVYDAASKTFCRPNWSGEGFSGLKSVVKWSPTGRRLVADRSPTGLQWLPALAEHFFWSATNWRTINDRSPTIRRPLAKRSPNSSFVYCSRWKLKVEPYPRVFQRRGER